MEDAAPLLLGVVFATIGILLATIAGRARRRRQRWPRAIGTVRRVTHRTRGDDTTVTRVVYRFEDAEGNRYSGTDTPILRAPRRGSEVSVVYDPDDPRTNETVSRWGAVGTTLGAIAAGVCGVGLLLVGVSGLIG